MEESEADLTRFRSWLAKIEARDWFDAPGGARARAVVAECAATLDEFEARALRREAEPSVGPEAEASPSAGDDRQLRAVPADTDSDTDSDTDTDTDTQGRRGRSR